MVKETILYTIMADDIRVPLLTSIDDVSVADEELNDDFEVLYSIPRTGLRPDLPSPKGMVEECGDLEGGGGKEVGVVPRKKNQHYSGSEMMVAVFVVAFDTKKGKRVLAARWWW